MDIQPAEGRLRWQGKKAKAKVDGRGEHMQVHGSVGHKMEPPSEASFVLKRRASAITVRPQRRSPALMSAPERDPSSPASKPGSPLAAGRASAAPGGDEGQKQSHPPRRGGRPAATPAGQEGAHSSRPAIPRIGVISDNHGYLDPDVLEIFAGVTHIIHAGDIMDPEILAQLKTVAPVTAVAGNVDSGEFAAGLPREVAGEIAGVRFVVGHKRKRLLKRLYAGRVEGVPDGAAVDLVIYGHDHVAAAAWVDDTLFLNPGTAGSPDDEDDGPTVAIVEKRPTGLAVLFVPLQRRDVEELPERPARS